MHRFLVPALALAAGSLVLDPAHAQGASSPAASSAPRPAASAPSSPAKKALVAKVLKLQQPGVEGMARQLVEQPAALLLQRAQQALQRVPQEQREQLARDIQADTRKYVEEATPIARDRAVAIAPQTIGALLESRFTEDELKQLVAILESPVNKKFAAMGGEMQRVLGEKLIAETRDSIEPKVRALEQSVTKRFEQTQAPAAGASAPKPASAPK